MCGTPAVPLPPYPFSKFPLTLAIILIAQDFRPSLILVYLHVYSPHIAEIQGIGQSHKLGLVVSSPVRPTNSAVRVSVGSTIGFHPISSGSIPDGRSISPPFLLLFRFSGIKRRNRAAVRFSESEG